MWLTDSFLLVIIIMLIFIMTTAVQFTRLDPSMTIQSFIWSEGPLCIVSECISNIIDPKTCSFCVNVTQIFQLILHTKASIIPTLILIAFRWPFELCKIYFNDWKYIFEAFQIRPKICFGTIKWIIFFWIDSTI